jgi:cell division protein FtsI (penicillin-binding protein 3)
MLIFVVLVFVVYASRLVQIQGVQAPVLAQDATQGRIRTVIIPASRGEITDRNGVPLATTIDAVNVTSDQTLVHNPTAVAKQIAAVLHTDWRKYVASLTGTHRFAYVAKGLSPDQWQAIDKLSLLGIYHEASSKRLYPNGSLAAPIIGFVNSEDTGQAGVEMQWQALLAGKSGKSIYEASAAGGIIPTATDQTNKAVSGATVRLTIDRDIQYVAEVALAKAVKQAKADSGVVVVTNPRTGELLALANVPSFDPKNVGNVDQATLYNRALDSVYEPGSTGKVITHATLIDSGLATPLTHVTVPNELTIDNHVFHDDISHGVWKLTLTGVMARSSNLGTILASEKLSHQTFLNYMDRFGVGSPTGLKFPGESDGLLRPLAAWSSSTFPTMAFGQAYSVNAVQMAAVYATIANNGLRVPPRIVASVVNPDGTTTVPTTAKPVRVVSERTATLVRAMLESVVSDDGTAPMAAIDGYRVAGKTGTANRVDPTCSCYRGYTASFIGMAPADKPQFVVAVTLQNPRNGHFGGRLAGPVFKTVMSYALQKAAAPPSIGHRPHWPITWSGH